MASVKITGWNRGLNSVEMIKAIRAGSDLNLAEAKTLVEAVLDGETRTVGAHEAKALADQLCNLGAVAEIAE